jgi:hypothetical protein
MLFLVVLIIALGWAGWFWSWGRDRFVSNNGLGLSPNPFAPRPASPLSAPRTASMARRRRREVLGALALAALLSFLLARAWSLLWTVHIAVDLALIAYAAAVFMHERPSVQSLDTNSSVSPLATRAIEVRRRLHPVLDPSVSANRPGPN